MADFLHDGWWELMMVCMQYKHTEPDWKQETSMTSVTRRCRLLILTHQAQEQHENSDIDL